MPTDSLASTAMKYPPSQMSFFQKPSLAYLHMEEVNPRDSLEIQELVSKIGRDNSTRSTHQHEYSTSIGFSDSGTLVADVEPPRCHPTSSHSEDPAPLLSPTIPSRLSSTRSTAAQPPRHPALAARAPTIRLSRRRPSSTTLLVPPGLNRNGSRKGTTPGLSFKELTDSLDNDLTLATGARQLEPRAPTVSRALDLTQPLDMLEFGFSKLRLRTEPAPSAFSPRIGAHTAQSLREIASNPYAIKLKAPKKLSPPTELGKPISPPLTPTLDHRNPSSLTASAVFSPTSTAAPTPNLQPPASLPTATRRNRDPSPTPRGRSAEPALLRDGLVTPPFTRSNTSVSQASTMSGDSAGDGSTRRGARKPFNQHKLTQLDDLLSDIMLEIQTLKADHQAHPPHTTGPQGELLTPTCQLCRTPILNTPLTLAENPHSAFFHRQCFRCAHCRCLLKNSHGCYGTENGRFYCMAHFPSQQQQERAAPPLLPEPAPAPKVTPPTPAMRNPPSGGPVSSQGLRPPATAAPRPHGGSVPASSHPPPCSYCTQPILPPSSAVAAFGRHWHPEHYRCSVCRKPADASNSRSLGVLLREHQGRLYCPDDFARAFAKLPAGPHPPPPQPSAQPSAAPARSAPSPVTPSTPSSVPPPAMVPCAGCRQPVRDGEALFALNAKWHPQCFNCQVCHQTFPDNSFYVFRNRPHCRYHYHMLNHSLCTRCRKPIEGPCAQVVEGRFHPACFTCQTCHAPLRDVYYNVESTFYCEHHLEQAQKSSKTRADRRRTLFRDL
ncbi:hypothetical protein IWQ60_002045 [Tieghemiomyces parasiticus]|uniref:LIM zinc-binding domain-containing protein n=1 Tax=Tieghemiomyces parasiticus TaxID=78921 RepID=A0A9W8AK42_9FUNG|nr:hypothetical protein IWQ60_002045 [Tieghemiomyces parasiticus]